MTRVGRNTLLFNLCLSLPFPYHSDPPLLLLRGETLERLLQLLVELLPVLEKFLLSGVGLRDQEIAEPADAGCVLNGVAACFFRGLEPDILLALGDRARPNL